MTCYTNCLHCDVCKCADGVEYKDCEDMKADCEHFKNKSEYVEVKHGNWVLSSRGFDVSGDYECSVCQSPSGIKHFYNGKKYSFCPDCGAVMVKGEIHNG